MEQQNDDNLHSRSQSEDRGSEGKSEEEKGLWSAKYTGKNWGEMDDFLWRLRQDFDYYKFQNDLEKVYFAYNRMDENMRTRWMTRVRDKWGDEAVSLQTWEDMKEWIESTVSKDLHRYCAVRDLNAMEQGPTQSVSDFKNEYLEIILHLPERLDKRFYTALFICKLRPEIRNIFGDQDYMRFTWDEAVNAAWRAESILNSPTSSPPPSPVPVNNHRASRSNNLGTPGKYRGTRSRYRRRQRRRQSRQVASQR
ncbi:hypothetical protein F5884DRAFT_778306 [Xylogone sp. PMI_703]|nr:hypothetical protein F5884DRAFT_778306 [Xylogone sp. PMI_703]